MRLLAALAATALASASFLEDTQSHYIAQRKLIEGDPTSSRNCPRCPGLASPRTNPEVRTANLLRTTSAAEQIGLGTRNLAACALSLIGLDTTWGQAESSRRRPRLIDRPSSPSQPESSRVTHSYRRLYAAC